MKLLVFLVVVLFGAAGPLVAAANGRVSPSPNSAADTTLTVPPAAIAADNAYWEKLGVTPPKGGFILAHPWSPP